MCLSTSKVFKGYISRQVLGFILLGMLGVIIGELGSSGAMLGGFVYMISVLIAYLHPDISREPSWNTLCWKISTLPGSGTTRNLPRWSLLSYPK